MNESISTTIIKEDAQGTHQLNINALLAAEGKLFLTGAIDSESVGAIIRSMIYMADNNIPIKLYIDSPGGEIRSGLSLIDVIEMISQKIPVDLICIGKAYSMAAVIVASGNRGHRFLLPHAEFMIHEPLIQNGAGGTASSVKSTAESLIKMRNIIGNLLEKHTTASRKQINSAMSRDTFFNAREVLAFGMADEIIQSF